MSVFNSRPNFDYLYHDNKFVFVVLTIHNSVIQPSETLQIIGHQWNISSTQGLCA